MPTMFGLAFGVIHFSLVQDTDKILTLYLHREMYKYALPSAVKQNDF